MDIKVTYKLNGIMYDKNLTFRQLQRLSGVSAAHLNDISNNQKDATVTTLCKIAVALKLRPEELYSYTIS